MGVMVPDPVMEATELSTGAKLCYGLLCRFAGRDGVCYPAESTMAKRLGVGTRQARRYVQELVEAGYIDAERRGDGQSNRYFFIWRKEFSAGLREDIFGDQTGQDCPLKRVNKRVILDLDYGAANRDPRDTLARYEGLRRLVAEGLGKRVTDSALGKIVDAGRGEPEQVLMSVIQASYRRGYGPGTEKGPRTTRWFEVTIADYFARGDGLRPAVPAGEALRMSPEEVAEMAEPFATDLDMAA